MDLNASNKELPEESIGFDSESQEDLFGILGPEHFKKVRWLYGFVSVAVFYTSLWVTCISLKMFVSHSGVEILLTIVVMTLVYGLYQYVIGPIVLNTAGTTKGGMAISIVVYATSAFVLGYGMCYLVAFRYSELNTILGQWYYYWPVFVFYHAGKLYLVEQYLRMAELTLMEKRSQFRNLQTRIYPHFLFNALNNIAAMLTQSPDKAESALLDLADVMRASIATANKLVTLEEEVDISMKYAKFEALRWKGMKVDVKVSKDCKGLMVPSLIVQPLIENAVYHGISKRRGGGVVALKIWREGNWIYITVANPLADADSENTHKGNGFALESVEKRLKLMYQQSNFNTQIVDGQYHAEISFDSASYTSLVEDVVH